MLITYNYEFQEKASSEEVQGPIDRLSGNFGNIIRQAKSAIPENENTEYLLIIGSGQKQGESLRLDWYFFIYNTSGQVVYSREAYR